MALHAVNSPQLWQRDFCGCVQAGGLPDGYDINYVLFGLTGEEAKDKMLHGKVWEE